MNSPVETETSAAKLAPAMHPFQRTILRYGLSILLVAISTGLTLLHGGYKLGVNAYIVKPVDFHQFVNAVKDLGRFWAVLNVPPPGTVKRK